MTDIICFFMQVVPPSQGSQVNRSLNEPALLSGSMAAQHEPCTSMSGLRVSANGPTGGLKGQGGQEQGPGPELSFGPAGVPGAGAAEEGVGSGLSHHITLDGRSSPEVAELPEAAKQRMTQLQLSSLLGLAQVRRGVRGLGCVMCAVVGCEGWGWLWATRLWVMCAVLRNAGLWAASCRLWALGGWPLTLTCGLWPWAMGCMFVWVLIFA